MLAPTSASTSPAYKVVSLRGAAEPSAHGRIVLSAFSGHAVPFDTPVGGAGSVIFDFLQSVSHTACDPTAT